MNSFYKLIASIIKEAEPFSGHASFRVVDDTAVGTDPIRELSLDAAPLDNDNVMVTLSWEGGVKEFEKTMPSKEADHMFQLISTDLSHIVSLTSEQKFEEAKEAMKNVLKTYAETTDTPVSTTAPKLNTTQASIEIKADETSDELRFERAVDRLDKQLMRGDIHQEEYDAKYNELKKQIFPKEASEEKNLWKRAKVSLRNIFPSGTVQQIEFENTKELQEYQGKGTAQDAIPLWDLNNGKEKPQNTLSPSSLSYEDVEEEKAKEHENLTKHIDETIKNELESALQEKAASVFGPADVELVKSMRAPGIGRNWDEVKKYFVKELNRDKDATTIFLDEQRKLSGDESVEVTVEEKKPEDALRPPENLVSPETHDKLLEDLKKKEPVEEVKEKEIEKVEPPIKEESAQKCPECGEMHKGDILKDNLPKGVKVVDLPLAKFRPEDIMGIPEVESCQAEILRADNADIRKVAAKCEVCEDIRSEEDPGREYDPTCVGYLCAKHEEEWNKKKASLNKKADDLNPLQEPIQEEPTMETPKQDVVPMGKSDNHQKPNAGDWVMVKSDLKDELPAFKAKFVSDYMSNDGTQYATVETEDQDLLEVEMYRVTKITDAKPAAQEADPLATPEIEMPQEAPVPVTPKLSDLSSSQDELLAIKAEAEALLKDVQGMGKISFKFIKKGLEKHANDSAFEGNGWVRVWIQDSEIEASTKYPEILKLPDENARIQALKELARELAHEALSLADSSAAKVGVQNYIESLSPSDHDRIDWVSLANPVNEEDEDLKFEQGMADKYGPDSVLPEFRDQVNNPKSSLESKLEKKASDFEKGISQNKTADPTPLDAPQPTRLKDLKIAPKYVDKSMAVPATPEMDVVLSKMDELEQKLSDLDRAKTGIMADAKAQIAKIDQVGERVQLEAEYQAAIEQTGVLINAVEAKVISWRDKILTMQNEEVQLVPKLTPNQMLEKIYAKFDGSEAFVQRVLNGLLSLAKNITEKTLVRFPNKKSSLEKEASALDEINQINNDLLEALKLLSSPL